MKQQIKLLSKLLLAVILASFSSCEKDLYEDAIQQNKNNNKLNITEKSFDELMLDEKFKNAYSKINKTKISNSFSKTVMEANYNFTISNLPAKVIDVNNKISYTFHITRDFSDADSFENLIVSIDSLKHVKAYIAKYQIDKSLNSPTNKIPFKSVKYHSIIYNSSPTSKVTDCVTITYSLCTDTGDAYCGGSICGFGELTFCSGSSGVVDNGSGTVWSGSDTSGSTGTVTTPVGGTGANYNPLTATNAQKFFYSFSSVGFERPLLTAMSSEASGLLSNYLNNNPYPSTNSTSAKSFITSLTQNSDWFTAQSVTTQTSVFNYLIANNFSSQSVAFVNQMVTIAVANNSTFSFNSSLNVTNAMSFNSVADVQNYLNDSTAPTVTTQITDQPNERLISSKIKVSALIDLEVDITQSKVAPFTISGVNASYSGTTFGNTWIQGVYTQSTTSNVTTITLTGTRSISLFINNIGVIKEKKYIYQIKINSTTGQLISFFNIL